jgi:hypothetical protein
MFPDLSYATDEAIGGNFRCNVVVKEVCSVASKVALASGLCCLHLGYEPLLGGGRLFSRLVVFWSPNGDPRPP